MQSKLILTNHPGIKEEVKTALMRSSLESNLSTNKPLGLQRIWVTATATKEIIIRSGHVEVN
jgi:hypothetical protein